MSEYLPHRGDHLFVWHKVRPYQHHGIVVTEEDLREKLSSDLFLSKMERLMIVEQNIHGLGIVTLKEFRTKHSIHNEHDIGLARYHTNPMEYYLNRSGTCYLTKRLEEDSIVENAIRIYNDQKQRDFWKTYSLVIKICE